MRAASHPEPGVEYVYDSPANQGRGNKFIFLRHGDPHGKRQFVSIEAPHEPWRFMTYSFTSVKEGNSGFTRLDLRVKPMPTDTVDGLRDTIDALFAGNTRVPLEKVKPRREEKQARVMTNPEGGHIIGSVLAESKIPGPFGVAHIDWMRPLIRNDRYESSWKQLLMLKDNVWYWFHTVFNALLELFGHRFVSSIFYFSFSQLYAFYRSIFWYPESACFSTVAVKHIRSAWPGLETISVDPLSNERHSLPEMNPEQWKAFVEKRSVDLDKFCKTAVWKQRWFYCSVCVYSSVMKRMLYECKNTYATEAMIHQLAGYSAEGTVLRDALQFLIEYNILVYLPSVRGYALRWVRQNELDAVRKIKWLKDDPECELYTKGLTPILAQNSPTYRAIYMNDVRQAKVPPLTQTQKETLSACLEHPLHMITGPPGTGKSYVTCLLIKMLIETNHTLNRRAIPFEVVVPTAKSGAALRAQLGRFGVDPDAAGQPICTVAYHYTLAMKSRSPIDEDLDPTSPQYLAAKRLQERVSQYAHVKFLIGDESSLWDQTLLSHAFDTFPTICKFIAVGDLEQNFPVDWGAPFHFLVPIAEKWGVLSRLTEYVRQQGTLQLATECVRTGDVETLVKSTKQFVRNKATYQFEHQRGESSCLYSVDAGATIPLNWTRPDHVRLCREKFLEAATEFIVNTLMKGKGDVQFITYNTNEMRIINRMYKVLRHKAAGTYDATTMEPDPLRFLHVLDKVAFSVNQPRTFHSLNAECQKVFLTERPSTPGKKVHHYDRHHGKFKHVTEVMNGDSGTIVDIYTFHKYPRAVTIEAKCELLGHLKNTDCRVQGDPSLEVIIVVKLDSGPSLLHLSLRDYKSDSIQPGDALSTYRAQGSEYPRLAFVCSNSHLEEGVKSAAHKDLIHPVKPTYASKRTFYVATSRGKEAVIYVTTVPFAPKVADLMREEDVVYASGFSELLRRTMKGELLPLSADERPSEDQLKKSFEITEEKKPSSIVTIIEEEAPIVVEEDDDILPDAPIPEKVVVDGDDNDVWNDPEYVKQMLENMDKFEAEFYKNHPPKTREPDTDAVVLIEPTPQPSVNRVALPPVIIKKPPPLDICKLLEAPLNNGRTSLDDFMPDDSVDDLDQYMEETSTPVIVETMRDDYM